MGFGVQVTLGGLVRAKFVGRVMVPQFDGSGAETFQLPANMIGPGRKVAIAARVRSSGGSLNITWGRAIDVNAYEVARL